MIMLSIEFKSSNYDNIIFGLFWCVVCNEQCLFKLVGFLLKTTEVASWCIHLIGERQDGHHRTVNSVENDQTFIRVWASLTSFRYVHEWYDSCSMNNYVILGCIPYLRKLSWEMTTLNKKLNSKQTYVHTRC